MRRPGLRLYGSIVQKGRRAPGLVLAGPLQGYVDDPFEGLAPVDGLPHRREASEKIDRRHVVAEIVCLPTPGQVV